MGAERRLLLLKWTDGSEILELDLFGVNITKSPSSRDSLSPLRRFAHIWISCVASAA